LLSLQFPFESLTKSHLEVKEGVREGSWKLRNGSKCKQVGERYCEGGEGLFILQPPKLAVEQLSSRDSEEFFGDSGHLSSGDVRILRTSPETGQHSAESQNSGDSELFCRKHSRNIPCDV